MAYPRGELPWSDLDPGIYKTVHALWLCGFRPVDSGDGIHKFRTAVSSGLLALPYPHVVMLVTSPTDLISETDRLALIVERWGSLFIGESVPIKATYTPTLKEDAALITLYGRLK